MELHFSGLKKSPCWRDWSRFKGLKWKVNENPGDTLKGIQEKLREQAEFNKQRFSGKAN